MACALFPQTHAQLGLSVTATPKILALGDTVNYSITISNTSIVQVQSLEVAAAFPTTATIIDAANTYIATGVQTNSGLARFFVSSLPGRSQARMTLALKPAARGNFALNVQAAADGTATVSSNIVINVGQAQVDLAVGVEAFPTNVLVGDAFDYTVTVTNFGPAVANSVNIQSVLPTGFQFLSVTPAIPSTFSPTTRILALTAGTFTNNTARDFIVRLQANSPTNAHIITSVVTPDNTDTLASNDNFTNAVTVLSFVTNRVAIVSASPLKFNRQNALLEQLVVVTNLSTNLIQSVRILVTNSISPNVLFNASGTNAGRPYLMLPSALAPSNSVAVLLQYYSPTREIFPVSLVAVEGPDLNPLFVPAGAPVPITRVVHLRTAYDSAKPKELYSSLFIEFASTAGRTYSLVYSPTLTSTNWIAAQPPIVANSTHGQFVDPGPQLSGDGDRFYSVIEHP